MKNKDIKLRLITSAFLSILLYLMLNYSYILLLSLILISVMAWLEINILIKKIFFKENFFLKIKIIQIISFIYLVFFSNLIIQEFLRSSNEISWVLLYVIMICILSDIGGFFFGKTFKGKKLTKISPNKTYSGSVGSFVLSIIFSIIYLDYLDKVNLFTSIFCAITISLVCQIGDLLISFIKRKAKVKDTGNILPGHGGILDRIDGILFALPFGIILMNYI